MFERRLKIFLGILLLVTCVMLLRALQLQVFGRSHWQQQAVESMKRPRLIETTRGAILDVKGRVMARDEACMDAAVDFRAVVEPPDPAWLTEQAVARVRREIGDQYSKISVAERRQRIRDAEAAVKHDINEMWKALAEQWDRQNQPAIRDPAAAMEEIDAIRRGIVERVRMRRRYVWYHKYRRAVDEQKGVTAPWYAKWLLGEGGAEGPDVDNFIEDVGEQEAPHSILHDIDNDTYITLKKNSGRYPGLSFPNSTVRRYPYANVASHVVGRLSKVMAQDIENEANLRSSELRVYQRNDLIGRMGLEALCEPTLRGTRGQVVRVVGENTEVARTEAIPGSDVRTTLDMNLQRDIEGLFKHVAILKKKKNPEDPESEWVEIISEMHGAAIVIDVPTGAVRALASWPNYDANQFDEMYDQWRLDELNQRLVNRATQWAIEPGSTVKPIVGIGAITDRILGVNAGIECTGYLVLNGHTFKSSHRCWTAKQFANDSRFAGMIAHHRIPSFAPHRGHDGNADGFLSFRDAIQRSCNVYFGTVSQQMGIAALRKWFSAFGLGRPTGIGIAESSGWLPNGEGMSRQSMLGDTLNAGIGQGQVSATALQMANVAATIARHGVWVRPQLVDNAVSTTTRPAGPDRVDLKLAPEAVVAARQGMLDVVQSNGGTATYDRLTQRKDVVIAGKTGSAQAPKFRTPIRDGRGEVIYEVEDVKDAKGNVRQRKRVKDWRGYEPTPSDQASEGPLNWYRGFGPDGTTLSHAWFIGFAPYDNPQVAFAVMVEYGGSGGYSAGSVANGVVDACIKHGYLTPKTSVAAGTDAGAAAASVGAR